jgi:hypothetical protein
MFAWPRQIGMMALFRRPFSDAVHKAERLAGIPEKIDSARRGALRSLSSGGIPR